MDTGWLSFSSFSSVSPGNVTWGTPSNAQSDDGITPDLNLDAAQSSYFLTGLNASPGLDADIAITGIEVRFEAHRGTGSGNRGLCRDHTVQLVVSGSRTGDNKATLTEIATTPTIYTFGGELDTWSLTLTGADVNASDFGLALKLENDDYDYDCRAYLDYMQIKFYYETASSFSGGIHTVL